MHEKKMLYISLVRSQLVYCSEIWKPCYRKDIEKLERFRGGLQEETDQVKPATANVHVRPERRNVLCTADFDIREYISFSDQQIRSGLHKKMNITRPKKEYM